MSDIREDGDGSAPGEGLGDSSTSSLFGSLAAGAWKLATTGPRRAATLAQRGLAEGEKLALSMLKRRMEAATADEDEARTERAPIDWNAPPASSLDAPAGGNAAPAPAMSAAELLSRLMEMSLEQSPDRARELLNLRILRQLVPDEARILAALTDGHESALMHLGAGPRVGPATQRWIENLSPVGREAGVALPDQVTTYLSHLRELDLLESGDEDPSLLLKYQLMEADTAVRRACDQIEKAGMRPRFFRRTIRLSETGKAFWAACQPESPKPW